MLKGWKTRIVAGATFALGIVDMLDPKLLTVALNLDERGHAILLVVLGVVLAALREVSHTLPPAGTKG